MQKHTLVAAALLSAGIVATTGCGQAAEKPVGPKVVPAKVAAPTKALTVADDNATVTVKAGTVVVVTLDSNITTGYAWDVSSIQGTVTQLGKVEYKSHPQPPGRPRTGGGGVSTAKFTCASAGTSTVNMEYKQGRAGQPGRTFTVKIVVVP